MKYGFLFVNFNNTNFSKQAIESLLSNNGELSSPVIIVDNCSFKESVLGLKELERRFPLVKVIYNSKNVGYFKGLNLGIKFIKENLYDIDYWVVGNNDLLFSKNFGTELAGAQQILDHYPVVSPNITTLDGVPQNPAVIRSISKFRELIYDLNHLSFRLSRLIHWVSSITNRFTDRSDERDCNVAQEIYQGYGACYIFGPRFFEHFSELWAPSFLMYEEFFLAKQLEGIGFKTFYEPSIKVTHQCKGATGAMPNKFMWERSCEGHKIYRKYVKLWS